MAIENALKLDAKFVSWSIKATSYTTALGDSSTWKYQDMVTIQDPLLCHASSPNFLISISFPCCVVL
jgi:hypothetical protein